MCAGILIGQPVAYLTNEIHTSANYIPMVISVWTIYVATIILNKIHSCNEFISLFSTANNTLNIKAYNYSLKACCAL